METGEGVCYLSLITDAYSHKIVGWAVGPTLETKYPLEALRMALSTIDIDISSRLIHHSDRGCQYCSNEYVSELNKYGVSISMTQSGDKLLTRCHFIFKISSNYVVLQNIIRMFWESISGIR